MEIKGDPAVAPAVERHDGFAEAIKGSNIKVVAETHADWDQEKALKFMEDTLQRFPAGQIQAVYAHNDNMAFGALRAIQAAGRDKEGILIVGIDGENKAIRSVAKGDLAATFTYSTVAPEGVIAAHALATNDLAALDKLGKVSKHDDGSTRGRDRIADDHQGQRRQFLLQGLWRRPRVQIAADLNRAPTSVGAFRSGD